MHFAATIPAIIPPSASIFKVWTPRTAPCPNWVIVSGGAKVPVTVKNVGDESASVSTLWMKLYGPSGNELANVEYYFDDSIAYAGSLLPGATKDTYIYFAE